MVLVWFAYGISFAGTPFEVKLEKDEKVESTYTALVGNATLHIVVVKDESTKEYKFTPYYANEKLEVKALSTFVSKNPAEVVSYHCNGDVFTAVLYSKEKKTISVLDYSLSSGTFISGTEGQKLPYDNLFTFSDKTILVDFNRATNELEVKTFTTGTKSQLTKIKASADKVKYFRKLALAKPDAVNQTEYVRNGSIARAKGYLTEKAIVYTLSDKGKTETFRFDLAKSEFDYSAVTTGLPKDATRTSDYVIEDKLAVLGADKDDIRMNVFDLATSQSIKSISVKDDKLSDDKTLADFLKQVAKTNMEATLTINKARNGGLAVRIDRVDKTEYNYNYNWWYLRQMQQMMWQQQQMMQQARMSVPRGFGPAQVPDREISCTFLKSETKAIEFTIDAKFGNVTPGKTEALYPDVDKDKMLEKLQNDKGKKEASAEFLQGEMRMVYFDPKSKTVKIVSEKL